MNTFRKITAAGSLLLLFAAPLPAAAATNSETAAQAVVDASLKELLAVLHDEALSSEQRLDSLGELVSRRFDLSTFSRIVIGREWKAFSAQQKEEFICEFNPYISDFVGSHFDRYQPENVEIVSAREEARGDVVVATRIVGGRFDQALLDYRMRKAERDWLVIDLSFEGVRWAANLRAQFSELISRGGPEDAIAALRSKNPPTTSCEGRSNAAPTSKGVPTLPIHTMAAPERLEE